MSVQAAEPEAKQAGAKKTEKKSKKKLIMIVVLVLLVGGGAYKFVLAPKPKPGPPVAGDVVSLPANTLNLSDGHYLKIAVDVTLVKGKAALATFQIGQANELVINQFSDRTVASLSTNAERVALTKQLETAMKKAYPNEIFSIYLTQFVTQ